MLLVVGEEPKTGLPGLALLTQQDIEKIVEDKDSQTKHKKVDEGGKGAVCWSREREKNCENLRYFDRFRNKLSVPLTVVTIFFRLMYNKTIIRFGFCDIQNNQGSW